MRFLFTAFLCSILAQLSLVCGQAPVKDDEITKKIKSFTDAESEAKEKWENLLLHRKERNTILAEIEELTKTNKELDNEEINLIAPISLKTVSAEIPSPTLTQITSRVADIKQLLETVESQLKSNSISLATSETRLKLIPDEITKIQANLSVLRAKPDPVDEINIFVRQELIAKLEITIKKLNLERIYLDKKIPIVKINLQTLAKDIYKIELLYTQWSNKLIDANKDTAASIKENTELLSAKISEGSLVKDIAEQTISLSNSLLSIDSIHDELKNTRKELAKLKQTLLLINEQQKYARERINLLEKADLSIDRETGTLLRKQRSELPNEKDLKLRLSSAFKTSTRNELALLKDRELLESILVLTPDTYENSLTDSQRSELTKKEFTSLISSTKKLHRIMISEREDLSQEYRQLITLLEKTHKSSKDYSTYIDTRLLWIVSHPPIGKQSFIDEAESLRSIFGVESLTAYLNAWKSNALESPVLWMLFVLILSALILIRQKLRYWKSNANKLASRGNCQSFIPTLITLLCDLAITAPLPILLAFLGWRTPFEFPIQAGLYAGSITCAVLVLTRRFCKPEGFFESNKMISEGHIKMLRKLVQSLFVILPLVVITALSLTKINSDLTQGRIFTILILIIMATAMQYLLLPKKRVLSGKKKPGFVSYLAYFTFVIFPISLVIVAATGYFISVLTLLNQLSYTLGITILIIFTSALLKRWLLVTRRKALINASKAASSGSESPQTEQDKMQEIHETVSKVSEQSAKLVRLAASVILVFSLIAIWSKTLPALSVLDDVKLWETATSESSSGTNSSSSLNPLGVLTGSTEQAPEAAKTSTSYISLQDLLVTIIVSFFTYLAAVNIPSLLQITVFNHLNLGQGTAFTITTALRYIIIISGIIWAFGSIGVTWNKIQWLAAAITLGIGFGLQEIFANFVAGLILLFERPIRIGDLITVGDINGRVSKIQMRATTILQFNNRELIVPNKEFITGQLVNWTLSDNVIRAEIPVGIAYGSDTQLAKSVLLKCAAKNERSLKNPRPSVIFGAFGASSLDFTLRVFISSVDDLVPVQSELHFAVEAAFREAGIEIAFPQQDIHIRSIDAVFPTEKKVQPAD